ncbi:hypothetical protein N7524_007546 [Penicillium chrysogenum]|nr:hypothetical protein N7524_007546 [Penicillium chrysogenum]
MASKAVSNRPLGRSVPAKRGTVDDTWLLCARELRGLLISNGLASCSVEIVDPMAFTPMNTYPVLQKVKVFWEWEPLLAPTLLDCSPTLLILVDRNEDWTETREKVVSILKKWHLQMLAVEIVMDRPVYQADHKGISTGLVEGLLRNDTYHSLSRVYGHPQRLRRFLGQPILYIGDLQCGFGFVSTYYETIFLRQVQLASGQWIVKYSPVIYSTDAYEPSGSQGHGPGPSVSMRQSRDIIEVATEEARREHGTMRRPRSNRIAQVPEAEAEAIRNAAVVVLKIRLGWFAG